MRQLHSSLLSLTQLLLATCTSAGYVQWRPCDGHAPSASPFSPETLSARLVHVNGTHDRLSLQVGRWVPSDECDRWAARIPSARLDFRSLGRSSSRRSDVAATCRTLARGSSESVLYLGAAAEVGAFRALSTFHVTVRLLGPDDAEEEEEERGCLQAHITPELSPAVSASLRYAPLGILLFVLVVSIIRSIRSDDPPPPSPDVDADADADIEAEASPRAVLPGVADCLQYLQFVFLTGGLSLFYPGFYQPAVSRLGWASLFAADGLTLVTHGQTYAGSGGGDGIYEVNGTYGGTFGLELMTQVVGAPMTMDTWLNMVILVVAVAALSALGLQVYSWFRVRPQPRVETGPRSGLDNTGIRRSFTRTLRIVLSYFMLPLVALSFYQLDNAAYLPAYHISLAAILIAAILAAFAWLLFQVPTRSLGALIFDGRKRYRSIPSSSASGGGGGGRQHKSFVLALFTLVFVRGVAIGGLQISGRAQLAVLGACELVLLACIVQFQAYSMLSVGTVSAVARFASLTCMVAFVPGVASDDARSAVGYLVLLLHLCMLVLGFFAPAAVHLGKICALRRNKPGPDVYNLRQLRRRPASRADLPVRPPTSGASFTDEDGSGPAHGRQHNASSFHLGSSSISGRDYYRPPRPSRISHSPSVDFRDGGRPNATVPLPLPTSNVSKSDSEERPDSSYRRNSSSNSSEAPSSGAAEPQPQPLHPRWADYSFRESDLFYGVPHPISAEPKASTSTSISAPEPAGVSRPSIRSLLPFHLWARVVSGQRSETAERGFSVARPSRASGFPPS
ncbi:Putative flavin carrier protein 3 [Hypoxylon texense]